MRRVILTSHAEHRRSTNRHRQQPGFTLIEVIIVVTIIGLLAGSAALRLSGMTGRARFQHAVERMTFIDAAIRSRAVRFNQPCQLKLEVGSQRIQRVYGKQQTPTPEIVLSGGVEISSIRSRTRSVSSGRLTLNYSTIGTTESYAVELSSPGQDSRWLFFAGRTGQVTELETDTEIEQIFRSLQSERTHAG